MGNAAKQHLEMLARSDARGFLQAFLEGVNGSNCPDVQADEVLELDETNVVHGIFITLVDSEGGCEGEGEYVHRIWSVTSDKDVISYIKVTGFYQSYNGTDYDNNWTLVEPKEVTVIQYVPVK